MNRSLFKVAPMALVLLVAAGCASTSSTDETKAAIAAAQQSADEAKAEAAEAKRMASEALQTANDAKRESEAANARIDAAFKKSMQK